MVQVAEVGVRVGGAERRWRRQTAPAEAAVATRVPHAVDVPGRGAGFRRKRATHGARVAKLAIDVPCAALWRRGTRGRRVKQLARRRLAFFHTNEPLSRDCCVACPSVQTVVSSRGTSPARPWSRGRIARTGCSIKVAVPHGSALCSGSEVTTTRRATCVRVKVKGTGWL